MRVLIALMGGMFALFVQSHDAAAFCGFYVGKADARLFNEASQVILARHGDRTVITMLNDYQGDLREFALVVPVPEVLKRDAVQVADRRIFERIDAYTAPRLAEYFDPNPCERAERDMLFGRGMLEFATARPAEASSAKSLGVTVEASYTVGEYDIVILSAKESDGLATWLSANGYRMPRGAAKALAPYLKQQMKFFVAKVNLGEQAKTGTAFLRPLQFAFNSERFMLPMRLGMLNARGPQDLVVYVMTPRGRVEAANYRTVKLAANMDLPTYVRSEFASFYRAFFDRQAEREGYRAVFTEYFWDMSWCDPCAADPLSREELLQAGVGWLDGQPDASGPRPFPAFRGRAAPQGAQPVMVTRLHLRYTPETFPEDLVLHETGDRANYQTRYVLRHPWRGDADTCPAAPRYLETVRDREEREAQALANLTGWDIDAIRLRVEQQRGAPAPTRPGR